MLLKDPARPGLCLPAPMPWTGDDPRGRSAQMLITCQPLPGQQSFPLSMTKGQKTLGPQAEELWLGRPWSPIRNKMQARPLLPRPREQGPQHLVPTQDPPLPAAPNRYLEKQHCSPGAWLPLNEPPIPRQALQPRDPSAETPERGNILEMP